MKLYSNNGEHSIVVDQFGGQVLSWQHNDEHIFYPQQTVAVPTENGETAYRTRGGMFMCFPHFGSAITNGHFTMPQHGILRDIPFEVRNHQKDNLELFKDLSSTIGFNYALHLEVIFRMTDDGFYVKVIIENKEKRLIPINFAFHPYFLLSDNWHQVIFSGSKPGEITVPKDTKEKCHDGIKQIIDGSSLNGHGGWIAMEKVRKDRIAMETTGFDAAQFQRPDKKFQQYLLWSDNPDKYFALEPFLDEGKNFATPKGVWLSNYGSANFNCQFRLSKSLHES